MQAMTLFAIATALAAWALPLTAAEAPGSAQACWQPAFEAGDADAVAQCYAPDAMFWLPGAPMMRGRAAIRAGYAGFFAAATIKSAKLVELGRVTQGHATSSWGTFTLVSVAKKDGSATTELGRYTDVSRKINGRWLYVVDHASDDPPVVPAN